MSKLFLLACVLVAATASAATLRSAESLMVEVRALRAENAMLRAQNEVLLSDGLFGTAREESRHATSAFRAAASAGVKRNPAWPWVWP